MIPLMHHISPLSHGNKCCLDKSPAHVEDNANRKRSNNLRNEVFIHVLSEEYEKTDNVKAGESNHVDHKPRDEEESLVLEQASKSKNIAEKKN